MNKKNNNKTIKYSYYTQNLLKYIITLILVFVIILIQAIPIAYAEETTETTSLTSEEDTDSLGMDAAKCVKISGDASTGYYLEFVDNIDEILQQAFDKNKSFLLNCGVEDITTFKKMIKAELATSMPNLGGIVESSDPISNGTEASASAGSTGSSGGDTTVIIDGEFVWPVAGQDTPEDRAGHITSLMRI